MTHFDFIDRTDSLIRALSTCALTYQDAKFDYFSKKLDQLLADYPEDRKTRLWAFYNCFYPEIIENINKARKRSLTSELVINTKKELAE